MPYALLSVSEKSGIVTFAHGLVSMGFKLLSTAGTAMLLQRVNIPVIEVSDYTGFPEIMDGRVKTLHPKIYAGILARPERDQLIIAEQEIHKIDLVVVNLYPFAKITAEQNCDLQTAIEHIDIGGVSLIRAAAKNYQHVGVIVDPVDYENVLRQLQQNNFSEKTRLTLAKKAFRHVAQYDLTIADYFDPTIHTLQLQKKQALRYGENPHQRASFYAEIPLSTAPSLATAEQLQGKELSFNNIADSDAALACVKTFAECACVIVKHANPCGVAIGSDLLEAYQRAYATDPTSAFGGVIAFNRPLDLMTTTAIFAQQFAEVIIAPQISDEARKIFQQKPNVRLLVHNVASYLSENELNWLDYKRVQGGVLIQDHDAMILDSKTLHCVTARQPSESEYQDLLFAWQVAKFVKSNAIVLAKNQMTFGIGAGQTSRVYSTRIAVMKAAEVDLDLNGAVMASEAFFPFRDSVDAAAEVGVTAIIQPGGSIRDQEVIDAANTANIAMLFTGIRHFRH